MLHKALEQFLTDVYWDEPDYLLVDLPPGTGDISISLAQFLPRAEVYVVTTPQPAAQRVAQRAAFMAEKVKPRGQGRHREHVAGSPATTASATSCSAPAAARSWPTGSTSPLLGQVPLVPELREGGDTGRPIVADRARQRGGAGVPRHRRADRRRARARPAATTPSSSSSDSERARTPAVRRRQLGMRRRATRAAWDQACPVTRRSASPHQEDLRGRPHRCDLHAQGDRGRARRRRRPRRSSRQSIDEALGDDGAALADRPAGPRGGRARRQDRLRRARQPRPTSGGSASAR